MKLSKLKELPTSRSMIDVFGGYNHNLRIGEGEFYDMTNLSSDNYPVLSPRRQRGVYAVPNDPQGMVAKDSLCYVDGGDFYINEYKVSLGLTVDDKPKNLISMGAYVIIMPDKKYVNTADLSDYGDIEAGVTTTGTATFELCKIDGVGYEGAVTQPTAPKEPENMDLWIDTSSTPHVLKQYAPSSASWVSIATTYIKISAKDMLIIVSMMRAELHLWMVVSISDLDIKEHILLKIIRFGKKILSTLYFVVIQ